MDNDANNTALPRNAVEVELDSTLDQQKRALRKAVLQRRDAIDVTERAKRSDVIAQRVSDALAATLPDGATISAYAAMNSEVDLGSLFDEAARHNWRFCFPCMMKNDDTAGPRQTMRFFAPCADQAQLSWRALPFVQKPLRSFTAHDPALACCELIDPHSINAVISPLVAFDDERNRLGYGGGNYDRFFEQLDPQTPVIGVAFDEQRVSRVPTEPHDIALPRIITG